MKFASVGELGVEGEVDVCYYDGEREGAADDKEQWGAGSEIHMSKWRCKGKQHSSSLRAAGGLLVLATLCTFKDKGTGAQHWCSASQSPRGDSGRFVNISCSSCC